MNKTTLIPDEKYAWMAEEWDDGTDLRLGQEVDYTPPRTWAHYPDDYGIVGDLLEVLPNADATILVLRVGRNEVLVPRDGSKPWRDPTPDY